MTVATITEEEKEDGNGLTDLSRCEMRVNGQVKVAVFVRDKQAGSERSRRDQPDTLVSSPTRDACKLTQFDSITVALFTCDSEVYQQITMEYRHDDGCCESSSGEDY